MAQSSKSSKSADAPVAIAAIERAWTEAQLALESLDERGAHDALTRADLAMAGLTAHLATLTAPDAHALLAGAMQRLNAVKKSTEQALAQCAKEIARAKDAGRRLREMMPQVIRATQIDQEA